MFNWFFIFKLFQSNYGSRLEKYITAHNPVDTGDVERLTMQYYRNQDKLWI